MGGGLTCQAGPKYSPVTHSPADRPDVPVQPSSNQFLNRVDTHALQALIINLNLYLLVLPTNPILAPGAPTTALEVGILVLHATVCLHLLVLFSLGIHQVTLSPRFRWFVCVCVCVCVIERLCAI